MPSRQFSSYSGSPTVVSLFSGAGGIEYGLEAAGFRTLVTVDMDRDACATLRHNRSWPVIERDVHAVGSGELMKTAGIRKRELDLLVGGPPCQPFSKSATWRTGSIPGLADPRSRTLDAYLKILEATLPRAFMIENVPGLASPSGKGAMNLILSSIQGINDRCKTRYSPVYRTLDVASYGVPQHRRRLVLVGLRDGSPFEFPTPTHGDGAKPFTTAWDALGDLPQDDSPELEPGGKWEDLLPSIPEGWNYLWHTSRGKGKELFGWRTRYWTFLLKLAKDKPSWTLQARPGTACGPFHWKNRRLSMRELCRLQTFPDDVEVISGARTIEGRQLAIQRQLGNAVPSLFAEVLGRSLRAQLGFSSIRGVPHLAPTNRSAPPRERTKRVPTKFLDRVGPHSPHPGQGLGPRALRNFVDVAQYSEEQ